jgi:SAM-dependent methyltransferase
MLANETYIVCSEILLFPNSCKLIAKKEQFFVYSFSESIAEMQVLIFENLGLIGSIYLDRFLIIEPKSEITRGYFWNGFFECFSSAYDDIIDKNRNINNIRNLYTLLRQNVSLTSESILLDFACGTGLSLEAISNIKLIGTDRSNSMLKIASAKGMTTIELSVLKAQGCYYDAILASYALHLCYDSDTLSLLWNALRNDAALAANFHKGKGIDEAIDFFSANHCIMKKIDSFSNKMHGDYYVFIK